MAPGKPIAIANFQPDQPAASRTATNPIGTNINPISNPLSILSRQTSGGDIAPPPLPPTDINAYKEAQARLAMIDSELIEKRVKAGMPIPVSVPMSTASLFNPLTPTNVPFPAVLGQQQPPGLSIQPQSIFGPAADKPPTSIPSAFVPPVVERYKSHGKTPGQDSRNASFSKSPGPHQLNNLSDSFFDMNLDAPNVSSLHPGQDSSVVIKHDNSANQNDLVNSRLAAKGFTPIATQQVEVRRKLVKQSPATDTPAKHYGVAQPTSQSSSFMDKLGGFQQSTPKNDQSALALNNKVDQHLNTLENRYEEFERKVEGHVVQLNGTVTQALSTIQSEIAQVRLDREEFLERDKRMTETVVEKVAKKSMSQLNGILAEGLRDFFEQLKGEVDSMEDQISQHVTRLSAQYNAVQQQLDVMQARMEVYSKQLEKTEAQQTLLIYHFQNQPR